MDKKGTSQIQNINNNIEDRSHPKYSMLISYHIYDDYNTTGSIKLARFIICSDRFQVLK